MTQQLTWSTAQLAVLQALEIPLHVRRAQPTRCAEVESAPGWRLCGHADQLTALRQLRWYIQLCRFQPPDESQSAAEPAPVIVVGDLTLPLEGDPARPSAEVKRLIYQALRTGRR
jgi:hypothetical protein